VVHIIIQLTDTTGDHGDIFIALAAISIMEVVAVI